MQENNKKISNGVMLNIYPDSIGEKLTDAVSMLKMSEFKDVFSLLYVLPTFFNSDLDRGFSIIDYNINTDLVGTKDLLDLKELNVNLKFDIVLNHLSVASPQFKDILQYGNESKFKDFFINWNEFWHGNGIMNEDGIVIPEPEFLNKLFMRKLGLPVLKVRFPDGTEQPYWNTFYQQITYNPIAAADLQNVKGLTEKQSLFVVAVINTAINDSGRAHITHNPLDRYKFKTPSLRNVEVSGPYMHDGRFQNLNECLDHYNSGIVTLPNLDPLLINGISLNSQDKNDIIAFLKTLTDHQFLTDKRFSDPN